MKLSSTILDNNLRLYLTSISDYIIYVPVYSIFFCNKTDVESVQLGNTYIADMDKCPQDKCCLDKCNGDSYN